MKTMKYGLLFGLAAAGLLLLAACQNGSAPSSPAASGYGKVKITTTGGGAGRTILPPVDPFDSYVYEFTVAGGTPTVKTPGANGFFELDAGTYTVSVKAYINNAGTSIEVATGESDSFVVEAGKATEDVGVKLIPKQNVGIPGKFTYAISYPAGASLTVTLVSWPDNVPKTLNPTPNAANNKSSEELIDLETGSYLLSMVVSKEVRYAGLVEAIHIYPGLTTAYTKEFEIGKMVTYNDNAHVAAITFGGTNIEEKGPAHEFIDEAVIGSVKYNSLFEEILPGTEIDVSTTPVDSFATVRFAMGDDAANDADILTWVDADGAPGFATKTATVIPTDPSHILFVEVTAADKVTKLYYKVGIQYLSKFTVTYDKNSFAPAVVPQPVEVKEGEFAPMPVFALNVPWDGGVTLTGWNTAADGSGGDAASTPVTGNVTLYAQWEFTPGTPEEEDDTLVIEAPPIGTNQNADGTQGSWDGSIEASTGIVTYSGGAVRYTFPTEAYDYDFVTLEYVSTGGGVILKKGTTSTDYFPDKTEDGNIYPTLESTGSFVFVVKSAGGTASSPSGIALQYNAGAGNSITVKFTKVTFSKGVRHTLTFDTDGGNNIPEMTIIEDVTFSLPTPVKDGFIFKGWKDEEDKDVTNSTIITTDLTLTAQWELQTVVAQTFTVDFSADATNLTAVGAGATAVANGDGSGYVFTYGSTDYDDAWAKFTITLEEGLSLSNYDTITFTLQGKGDSGWKEVKVLAGKPLPSSGSMSHDSFAVTDSVGTGSNGLTAMNLSRTIDPAKTASLTGVIEICIWERSAKTGSQGGTDIPTEWTVTNVTFNAK